MSTLVLYYADERRFVWPWSEVCRIEVDGVVVWKKPQPRLSITYELDTDSYLLHGPEGQQMHITPGDVTQLQKGEVPQL